MTDSTVVDMKPKPKIYTERIGNREWELVEERLDIFADITLWNENPRLQTSLPPGVASESDLELALQASSGYDNLRRSIEELGQMEPIYVWRADSSAKYTVLEGATRVSILRELSRKHPTGVKQGKFRTVRAKILPPDFTEIERTILLARIHVRGSGVRAWGRYIEAKFIHEAVTESAGKKPLMNVTEMAAHMGKSVSWVQRLRDAFQFARAFIDHVDTEEAEQTAAAKFSTLEEISKATTIGAQLRDYKNEKYDDLRADVFNMVRNDAFKEYREARFLKEFHDDPEKWEQLKSGEKGIATKLAREIHTNSSSPKAKVSAIEGQVQRAIDRGDAAFVDEDIESLERAITAIRGQIHPGVRPVRVHLQKAARALTEVSMADVKELSEEEVKNLREGFEYFEGLVTKHWKKAP
jgi:hypothetical protein